MLKGCIGSVIVLALIAAIMGIAATMIGIFTKIAVVVVILFAIKAIVDHCFGTPLERP